MQQSKNACEYLHEEYFIGIPMKYTLQSTALQWYDDQDFPYCGNYPCFNYRWLLFENVCLLTAFVILICSKVLQEFLQFDDPMGRLLQVEYEA